VSGPRPARRRTSALLIGILALLTAVLVTVFVLRLARSPGSKVQLGTDQFQVGKADRLARPVAGGGPLLFQALRGGELDIFVQHLGPDSRQGWSAFEAHAPGASRRCQLRWQPPGQQFLDPCTQRLYPADGTGLTRYATTVTVKGEVVVDLRQPAG
jgi:hypothetical protein